MSVVKINVLTVPADMRSTLEQRFAGRAGMVEKADGFEWFELLRPVDGTDNYLVYTRWRSEEDFLAWQSSQAFSAGHGQASAAANAGGPAASGSAPAGGRPGGHPGGPPAASGAQLWSFEVIETAG